ncbi:MAG: Holliday junction branch migration protein RuvA [Flavobacteriaceae bacterium]|jgi:Holliday junction DNA helicase RuvA|nr:Holliday junction branch migration protein RuvA [Flavobacteriaceae bacterium]
MIAQVQGRLVEKNLTDVVIDCQGVGYFLNISLHTYSQIPDQENIRLYTQLLVREDAMTLYGFASKEERSVFNLLLSVSGVGASTARTMLSSLTPRQVRDAIVSEDIATIQGVKGIGAKTAQRVILDLKDKIIKLYGEETSGVISSNTNRNEALSALETLGYARKIAEKACDAVLKHSPSASVEEIIKLAFKHL